MDSGIPDNTAARIGHDLNNQLMLILGFLSIEDLGGARTATEKCAELTAELLQTCRRSG